jgi:hydrogenase expression/formation protein HypC
MVVVDACLRRYDKNWWVANPPCYYEVSDMCLAVVGKVIELENDTAVVDIEGNRLHVVASLLPDVKVSDYVLVHAGMAISIISETDYQQQQRIFREIEKSAQRAIESD